MRRLAVLLAGIVLGLAVSACGSDARPAATTTSDGGEPKPPARATVEERPGCGHLCQQAGPPAGTDNPGCPGDSSDNCAPCPKGGCAELLTGSADVQDGIFAVDMACKVDHRCVGALHVYVPGSISDPVAASDVSVPPGDKATLPIALTTFGRHVVGVKGDFAGNVYVFLEGTGVDRLGNADFTASKVRLSAAQEELLLCDGEIEVARNTSCPFAENVFTAYAKGAMAFEATSPTTGRSYQMSCHADAATVYCTGGHDAFVTFPEGGQ